MPGPGGETSAHRGQATMAPEVGRRLEDLYLTTHAKIRGLCRAELRSWSEAEDAVQETFVRVARQLHRLEGDLEPYVTVTARNVCRNLRRARRTQPDAAETHPEIAASVVQDPAEIASARLLLLTIWKRLSERERALLAAHMAGMTIGEVARRSHHTPATVMSALSRARRHAREIAAAIATVAAWFALRSRLGGLTRDERAQSLLGWLSSETGLQQTALACGAVLAVALSSGHAPPDVSTPHLASATHGVTPPAATAARVVASTAASSATTVQQAAPAPAPAHTPTTPSLVSAGATLLPGSAATPEDGHVSAVTPSPDYGHDGTVFATGQRLNSCVAAVCPVLFVSHDRGRTWAQLPANGYTGGPLLLPADYATSHTLLASSTNGLLRSDDGGRFFRLVVPGLGVAALSSDPSEPGYAVVSAAQGLVLYEPRTGAIRPGPLLPAGVGVPQSAAVAGGRIWVLAPIEAPADAAHPLTLGSTTGVYACTTVCVQRTSLPGGIRIVMSPSFARDHTMVVNTFTEIFVSRDAGGSFTAIRGISDGATTSAVAPDGSVVVVTWHTMGSIAESPLHVQAAAPDAPETTVVPRLPAPALLQTLAVLPDGRWLSGMVSAHAGDDDRGGIGCSMDRGSTWQHRC